MWNTLRTTVDWWLLTALLPILGAGLVTMSSFTQSEAFFTKQLIWIIISFVIFFIITTIDLRFLKRTDVIVTLYMIFIGLLIILFAIGSTVKGAQSWFSIAGFALQPSEPMKVILVLLLAKYLSRRHIEIARVRHIFISGFYFLIPFLLVFIQPDLGTSIVLASIWFGMILMSGISKKHLFTIIGLGIGLFLIMWFFVLQPYQKQRLVSFIDPLSDIRGTGYNAYQSAIAVGSGQLLGKGVGYGTQSRLQFLPEHQTDFIFAAFAEEWGFIGSLVILFCFLIVMWRLIKITLEGTSNFEILTGAGITIFFMCHIIINIGMNVVIMPITGLPLPFMSYGGSHLVTEFIALGIIMSLRKNSRGIHKNELGKEFYSHS